MKIKTLKELNITIQKTDDGFLAVSRSKTVLEMTEQEVYEEYLGVLNAVTNDTEGFGLTTEEKLNFIHNTVIDWNDFIIYKQMIDLGLEQEEEKVDAFA